MSPLKKKSVLANKVVSLTKAFDVELSGCRVSRKTALPTKNKTKQQVYSAPLGSLETLYNYTFDKGRLKSLVLWSLKKYGEAKTIILVENLKKTGFEYATKAGISLGVEDLKIPPKKAVLLYEAEIITKEAVDQFERSEITGVERYQRLIETWHRTSEELKQEVIDNFEKTDSRIAGPVYMMAFSGARGNISQVRQLVGMRGLMSDPKGQLIDYPIRSNFREGLTITEYIISSYGARKGIVDTALRTATAGYLTRRLVDVAQHVVISAYDCGTSDGVFLTDIKEGTKTIFSLQTRLLGRVLARNLYKKDPRYLEKSTIVPEGIVQNKMRSKLASRNQEVSANLAAEIPKHYKKVFVRSPLTCNKKQFICQLCYGWSLAQGNLVSIGEAVGIVAAQSIGEPGTQLTMRTFHTGGAFAGEISDQIRAPFNGIVHYPDKIAGMLCRNPDGKMVFLTKIDGVILVSSSNCGKAAQQSKQFKIPAYTLLYNQPGESVHHKQVIAQISAIARQAGMQEDASLVLKSQMQGQFMIQKLTLQSLLIGPKFAKKIPAKSSTSKGLAFSKNQGVAISKVSRDNLSLSNTNNNELSPDIINPTPFGQVPGYNPITQDKLFAAWNWGYAWILSCQKYHMPVFSSSYGIAGRGATLIPFSGDFVDNNSSLVQVDWYLPQHGGFYTSFGAPTKVQATNPNQLKLSTGFVYTPDQNLGQHEKAPLLKPINYGAQAWPEKQQSVTLNSLNNRGLSKDLVDAQALNNNSGEVKIQKTLLALDIRNVVYKKFGYFVDTNKGLTFEGKTYSTVLFLPTNLKGGTAAKTFTTNSLFNFTLDSYAGKEGQKKAPTQPRQKLKRGQKAGNPKVFGVQAFIKMPQKLPKIGDHWIKSGGLVTNLSQNLLSNLPKSYRKTKITFVTNGLTTLKGKSPSFRARNITWPLDKGPMLSHNVLNKTSRAFPKSCSANAQNLDPYTQYRRFLNYKKTGTDIAHQIKKYYKKNHAQLKASKLLEPVRDFFKEFHATSLLPTLKVTPKYTTNKNLKVWYSKKNLEDCLLHRAAISIKNNISKAMSNKKMAAAIKALPNQSYLSLLKGNNTKGVTFSKNKHGYKKNKAGLISKVTLIQNKYAPLGSKRQQAYSRAEQLIENQRISRFYPISNSDAGSNLFVVTTTRPESGLAKQQSPLTSSSYLSKRKYRRIKASLISGVLTSLLKQSMQKLYNNFNNRQSLVNGNPHRGLDIFNYLVSGLTVDTLNTMCWYSNKKPESCPSGGPFSAGQKPLGGLTCENDSRLEVSNLVRQSQSILPTSNKWVYKTFQSMTLSMSRSVLEGREARQVSKVVAPRSKNGGKSSKNSWPAKPLPDKDSYIKKFFNYNFGQNFVLSTGLNACLLNPGDVVWYINKKPRFLPKEFLPVGVAVKDATAGFLKKSSTTSLLPGESSNLVVGLSGSPPAHSLKSNNVPAIVDDTQISLKRAFDVENAPGNVSVVAQRALTLTNLFKLTKPIYLHVCKSSWYEEQQHSEHMDTGVTTPQQNNKSFLLKSQKSNNILRSQFNRATIIRTTLSDGQGDVKNTTQYKCASLPRPTKFLGHVQPTLKRYSLDTHINNSSNWSSSLIQICRTKKIWSAYSPKKVSVYNNTLWSNVVNTPSFCLAGTLVIKATVPFTPANVVGQQYTVFNKPQELTKRGATKCFKAVFNCYTKPQVFYKKVDISRTLAPKKLVPNCTKRPSTATSRMLSTILNKQKRTLNPLAKTPNANLFVYSLAASGVSSKTNSVEYVNKNPQSGPIQTQSGLVVGPQQDIRKKSYTTQLAGDNTLTRGLRTRQKTSLLGLGSNLTSLLLTYHAPNTSFCGVSSSLAGPTYKIEDLVQQNLRVTAEQPTAKLGQAYKFPKTIQKLNTKLRKAGLEELFGSKVSTKPFYMRQAYEVSKYTALGAVTFNEMYINIAPPTSSLKALSKATMLEGSQVLRPLFVKRDGGGYHIPLYDRQSNNSMANKKLFKNSFYLENYLKKAALVYQVAAEPLKLLQFNPIGAHITLNTGMAPLIAPHSFFNQAGLELATLFKYKNFMRAPQQFPSREVTTLQRDKHFGSSKASNKKPTTNSNTGYKLAYWPLTGGTQSGVVSTLFGMSKTKYHVAPPAHLGGSERPQFSNISNSLMALASTSFLSTHTGEVVYGFGYSRSPKKALFGKDNPLAYLTKQKIHNNQTRCLILTSKDLKGYNIELFKSDQKDKHLRSGKDFYQREGLQDSKLSRLSVGAHTGDLGHVAQKILSNSGGVAIQLQWANSVKRSKNVSLCLAYGGNKPNIDPRPPVDNTIMASSVGAYQGSISSEDMQSKDKNTKTQLPTCGQLTLKGQVVSLKIVPREAEPNTFRDAGLNSKSSTWDTAPNQGKALFGTNTLLRMANSASDSVPYKNKLTPQITKVYTSPGQIIGVHWSIRTPNQMSLTIRKGQPIFISARTTFHSFHGDFVKNNESVVTLIYQKIKTGDIIQGIPKVEQFFEARTTKRGRLFRENLPNLLKGLFLKYYYQNLNSLKQTSSGTLKSLKKHRYRVSEQQNNSFWRLRKTKSVDLKYLAVDWAVKQSFYKIRQIAVDGVLRVYRSQGVSISDKHLEVIVKQMTTKVRVIDRGHSALFPGELVDYEFVQKLNGNDTAFKHGAASRQQPVLIKKVLYEPMVLGITKASLHVDSFLSAASFQQTARILRESALVKKRDFLKGVKENVMVGNLIPTGTGYIVS